MRKTHKHLDQLAANPNVALYLRVSTGRQAEQDLSIPDQRAQALAWCESRGWQVVAEYVEPGASATDDRRPEFQKMVERTCDGQNDFDVIVVHSFSRFFRDAFGLEFYIRKLAKHGVRLLSITQELGDDPAQVMMRQVIALFDEYQSKENAKHTLRSMKENARQGYWNGAPPPYGFKSVEAERRGHRIKKKLAIDAVEAEVVRQVFRLVIEGDGDRSSLGIKAIAVWLNENGYCTRRGGSWGTGQLHSMLTNPVYAGQLRFNRIEARSGKAKKETDIVHAEVPAIVDTETFEHVQRLLKQRNAQVTPPRFATGPVLLGGLAVCASCKGAMTLRTGTSRWGDVYRYYACSSNARKGKTACRGRSIRMDKLDTLVVEHLAERLLRPERLGEVLHSLASRRAEKTAAIDRRIAELEKEARDAEDQLRRLYTLVERGLAKLDDILKERIEALRLDRDRASVALERAMEGAQHRIDVSPALIEQFGSTMRERLASSDNAFRKSYIAAIVDRIEVDDNTVRIIGRKEVLEQAVRANCEAQPGVRGFVPKWRPVGDSNPCYQRERLVS